MLPLRVLIAEDNPNDTELVLRELHRAGYDLEWLRVDTEADYLKQLHPGLDIILSDYDMPTFSGPRALRLLKESGLDIPFIIISGTIGEEVAVEVMKMGAADYLLKDRLVRLGPAVRQAVEQGQLRRKGKQMEAALRQSEERFASAFENAPIGVALVSTDGHWIKVNRALCELVGYSETELLAASFQDITHPDDLEMDLEYARQMLAREINSYQMEKRYVHAQGHLITVILSVSLVPDSQGQPAYFISQIQDITSRREAELKIRFNEQRYRSLVEATTAIVWDTPASGEFEVEQPSWSAFTGQSFAELQGWGWLDAIHPEDRAETARGWSAAVASRTLYKVEHRVRAHDQSYHHMAVSAVPILAEDGTILQWIGIHSDVTARKQSEAALEKAHRELVEASHQAGMAEVAAGVLHNVGNVLNSVNVASYWVADTLRKSKATNLSKVVLMLREHEEDLGAFLTTDPKGRLLPGYLSQLADHLADEQESALRELAELQKNIEHIKEIVNVQQSFASVSGLMETLQVTDIVDDALRMNSSSFLRHDTQVLTEFENLPPVALEKHKVLQILVNLIHNARRACDDSKRPDKQLILRVTGGKESMRISVTDNGIGIPAENLNRIFNHGFTTKKDGHGFGLHSGANAAKEMGGKLTVHSDGPGHGATFTLELPVNQGIQA